MRILVTGGAGFIGSHVVDAYIDAGHKVAVVDNLVTGNTANLNPAAAFFEVDICNRAALAEVFERVRPEVVNHHAAHADVRRSVDDPVYDATQNVLGTINLLELARAGGARKFIFISSGGATYGEPERLPVAETEEQKPLCPYGASKLCGEKYVALYHRLHGLDYTILRYPNVYGPRQDPKGEAGVVAIFNLLMLTGKPCTIFGDGSKTRDYVFVTDLARANVAVAAGEPRLCDAFNLGWGRQVSDFDIFDGIRKAVGVDIEPRYAAFRAGEVMHIALDAGKAQRTFGWRPQIGLEEGLRRCTEYYRAHVAAS